jgi:hypothetical protein
MTVYIVSTDDGHAEALNVAVFATERSAVAYVRAHYPGWREVATEDPSDLHVIALWTKSIDYVEIQRHEVLP